MADRFYRMKYIFFFSVAVAAAFFTYQTFMDFKAAAHFSNSMLVLNTIIFLVLWFVTFTSHTDFVRRNIVLMLVIPAIGVYLTNFFTAMTTPNASLTGFIKYVGTSSLLLFASYQARKYEEKLKERKGRFV